jgi:hypothetical protein
MSKTSTLTAGKKDIVLLPIADLKMKFDVRKELNEDRVLLFMEMYESGNSVPPIEVVRGTTDIHDGRHRKAALDHLGRKHAECVFVESMGFVDQLMDAFAKNMSDSPFPPTRADTVFVMKQLLEAGTPSFHIQVRFQDFYKPSHVRKLLKDAHSNVMKTKMAKAKQAVAHGGLTIKAASQEHGVELERLQEEITGVRRVRKETSVTDIKTEISNRYRGNTTRTVGEFRRLFERFEDGEMSEKSVLEVLLHVQRLNTDAAKRVNSWIERFETLKASTNAKS